MDDEEYSERCMEDKLHTVNSMMSISLDALIIATEERIEMVSIYVFNECLFPESHDCSWSSSITSWIFPLIFKLLHIPLSFSPSFKYSLDRSCQRWLKFLDHRRLLIQSWIFKTFFSLEVTQWMTMTRYIELSKAIKACILTDVIFCILFRLPTQLYYSNLIY